MNEMKPQSEEPPSKTEQSLEPQSGSIGLDLRKIFCPIFFLFGLLWLILFGGLILLWGLFAIVTMPHKDIVIEFVTEFFFPLLLIYSAPS